MTPLLIAQIVLTLFVFVFRLPRTRLLVHRRTHLPRPNLRAYVDITCNACKPVISHQLSPQSSTSPPVPNPFFGKVGLKKTPVHVKDDFNPFKFNKVAEANARLTAASLPRRSPIIKALVDAGQLKIAAAMHDITTGKVTWLS